MRGLSRVVPSTAQPTPHTAFKETVSFFACPVGGAVCFFADIRRWQGGAWCHGVVSVRSIDFGVGLCSFGTYLHDPVDRPSKGIVLWVGIGLVHAPSLCTGDATWASITVPRLECASADWI